MMETLAWTALVMGLAGGPHCVGMCAAPCAGIVAAATPVAQTVHGPGQPIPRADPLSLSTDWAARLQFQAGRMLGYALLGAVAATAMESAAWLSAHTSVLRPLWTLMHTAVLAWGLMLLVLARQPVWARAGGRSFWSRGVARLRPLLARRGAVFATGMLWALLPCGLLYSALLLAALSGGPWQGALCMALFAAGSAVSLLAGPWVWRRAMAGMSGVAGTHAWRDRAEAWGTRLSGLLLTGMAVWALWHDQVMQFAQWCGVL